MKPRVLNTQKTTDGRQLSQNHRRVEADVVVVGELIGLPGGAEVTVALIGDRAVLARADIASGAAVVHAGPRALLALGVGSTNRRWPSSAGKSRRGRTMATCKNSRCVVGRETRRRRHAHVAAVHRATFAVVGAVVVPVGAGDGARVPAAALILVAVQAEAIELPPKQGRVLAGYLRIRHA